MTAVVRSEGPSDSERIAMVRAIELAGRGAGTALPNPVVGCVLLDHAGSTVGEGFHAHSGGPHAEVVALGRAGSAAAGATAVVTLEPCRHTGRTGPCTRALLAAGVRRVVIAVRDPWVPAAGGAQELRDSGVDVVELPPGELRGAAEDVNRVWLTATRLRRPFVTAKAGVTVDGRVAAPDGSSRWITSPDSRRDVHELRARVDTMMVGVGTVLADDAALTVRNEDGTPVAGQPLRVVLDTDARTPPTARVLDDCAPTLLATAVRFGRDRADHVDAAAVLAELYRRGQRHVLLEGGPRVTASLIDAGLVDEIVLYVAPLVLGAGRSVLDGGRAITLPDARPAELRDVLRIGPDLRLRYALTIS